MSILGFCIFLPKSAIITTSRDEETKTHSWTPERRMHMPANTKLKITYQTDENKTTSKTLSNMNPEATNANLLTTAEKLNGLQSKTVKSVERIDTTVLGNWFFYLSLPIPPWLWTTLCLCSFAGLASITLRTAYSVIHPKSEFPQRQVNHMLDFSGQVSRKDRHKYISIDTSN